MYAHLRSRIGRVLQHWFVRRVAILQIGTVAATLTQAVAGVLIARLLAPEAFGIYALAMGLAGMMSIVFGVGIQESVTSMVGRAYHSSDRAEVVSLFAYALKASLMLGMCGIAIGALAPWIAHAWYGASAIGWYALVVVCASVISTLFFALASVALQISGGVRSLSAFVFLDIFVRNGLALGAILLGFGVAGATAGHFVGACVIALVSAWLLQRTHVRDSLMPSWEEILSHVARVSLARYMRASALVAFDRNIGTLFAVLPVVLLGTFVTAGEVGAFKVAFGFINIGVGMIGPLSTLLNGEFPRLELVGLAAVRRTFVRATSVGVVITAAIAGVLALIAPTVFPILYGELFADASHLVALLFGYGVVYGIGVALGPLWRALHAVHYSIGINIGVLALGIPTGLWAMGHFGVLGAIGMVTAWYGASHIVSWLMLWRIMSRRIAVATAPIIP